jgi:hypothetical protein
MYFLFISLIFFVLNPLHEGKELKGMKGGEAKGRNGWEGST